jgi:hypothetical protein
VFVSMSVLFAPYPTRRVETGCVKEVNTDAYDAPPG